MNAPVAPISNSERIPTLDAVRGFTLLGIFIMNTESFSASLFARYGGVARNTAARDFAAVYVTFVTTMVLGCCSAVIACFKHRSTPSANSPAAVVGARHWAEFGSPLCRLAHDHEKSAGAFGA